MNLFSLFIALAMAADSGPIRVRSYVIDQVRWERSVNPAACTLGKERCEKLVALLHEFKGESVVPFPKESKHETHYEVEINQKWYPVIFKSPELCSIARGGKLDCMPQKLSVLERMLLILAEDRDEVE